MLIAYVLVSTQPQKEHNVYTTLLDSKDITEIHPLFGEWDLICKIEAETQEQLSKIVTEKIRNIDGVPATKTLTGCQF